MNYQTNMFSGEHLRDTGIKISMDNADRKIEAWTDQAYNFLLKYTKTNNEFMAEDVRNASHGIIPTPPSNRAWGGIFVRAAKNKIIQRKGFKNVTNSKAHCTPATLWGVVSCS